MDNKGKLLGIAGLALGVFAIAVVGVTMLGAPGSAHADDATTTQPAQTSQPAPTQGSTCGAGGTCDGSCGGACGGSCGAASCGCGA